MTLRHILILLAIATAVVVYGWGESVSGWYNSSGSTYLGYIIMFAVFGGAAVWALKKNKPFIAIVVGIVGATVLFSPGFQRLGSSLFGATNYWAHDVSAEVEASRKLAFVGGEPQWMYDPITGKEYKELKPKMCEKVGGCKAPDTGNPLVPIRPLYEQEILKEAGYGKFKNGADDCGTPIVVHVRSSNPTRIYGRPGCWMSFYRQPNSGVGEITINSNPRTTQRWSKDDCPDLDSTRHMDLRLIKGKPFKATFTYTREMPDLNC